MSDKIEEGLRKREKLTNAFFFAIFVLINIGFLFKLITKDFETGDLVFIIIEPLTIIYLFTIERYIFPNKATKITVEKDLVTVKLLFNKTITIPLTSITGVEIFGYEPTNNHFFIIKYDDKEFNTMLLCCRHDREVDYFIAELKRRIAKAKEEHKEYK